VSEVRGTDIEKQSLEVLSGNLIAGTFQKRGYASGMPSLLEKATLRSP